MLKTNDSFQAALEDISKRAKERADAMEEGVYPVNPDLPVRLPGAERGYGDRLNAGDALWPYYGGPRDWSTLTSQNGSFQLVLQTDGNLVVYHVPDSTVRWASWTQGRAVAFGEQQGDGNFVLYGPNWEVCFATWTQGQPGAYLLMQN